jgi:hypothetical protein
MTLWSPELKGQSIHLAVEGSCGGTTIGLQLARQVIENGGRVVWVAPEFPDGLRFSQIFDEVPLVSSSRFHAMNLVGALDIAFRELKKAASALPGVKLVVLDDYSPDSGRMPKDVIEGVNTLIADVTWATLMISKGGESMDDTPLRARGAKDLQADTIWLLTRPGSDSKRVIHLGEEAFNLRLTEAGFEE